MNHQAAHFKGSDVIENGLRHSPGFHYWQHEIAILDMQVCLLYDSGIDSPCAFFLVHLKSLVKNNVHIAY